MQITEHTGYPHLFDDYPTRTGYPLARRRPTPYHKSYRGLRRANRYYRCYRGSRRWDVVTVLPAQLRFSQKRTSSKLVMLAFTALLLSIQHTKDHVPQLSIQETSVPQHYLRRNIRHLLRGHSDVLNTPAFPPFVAPDSPSLRNSCPLAATSPADAPSSGASSALS